MKVDDSSRIKFNNNSRDEYITTLQTLTTIEDAIKKFFSQISKIIAAKEISLIKKINSKLTRYHLAKDDLVKSEENNFTFVKTKKDTNSHCEILPNKIIAVKHNLSAIIQVELSTEKSLDKILETKKLLIEFYITFFLNHLLLITLLNSFRRSSIIDDITSVYNQSHLKHFIRNEIDRSKRFNSVFSVIFFDLDNLKEINEQHGHLIGTEILKEVAIILNLEIRSIDLIARFGGDEFVIVLLNTTSQTAFLICQRIQQTISNHIFLKKKNLRIHISGSFGIASYPKDSNEVDELINKADHAMYEVKHKGKNGIKIYVGE